MIETRYSIEYIDPPNSGKKRSVIGKFFIYAMLTISILVAIVALIFSNLPDNTSRLLIDRVKAFTSARTEPKSFPTTSLSVTATSGAVENSELTKKNTYQEELKKNQKTHKNELEQQKLLVVQNTENYKKEIDLLAQENTEQHEKTVKLIKEKQNLTIIIDNISKQLDDEKQKKSELHKKISTLQAKNKTASNLLKNTTEINKTYAIELKKLKQKELKTINTPAVSKVTNQNAIVIEKVMKKTAEKIETKTTRNTAAAPQEKEKSQVDAIVAAMEAANQAANTQASDTNKGNTE
jgi:hypothetical protein